ncbi:MAG: P-loop NTPase fold protein [Reyranellaceae bacterium]
MSPSDAIVRALLRQPSSLREHVNLDQLAEAVEAARNPSNAEPPPSPGVADEINGLLSGLEIEATDEVRQFLLWGAARRPTSLDPVRAADVLNAIVETNSGRVGLPTDPTEMLKELSRQDGEKVNTEGATTYISSVPNNPLRFEDGLRAMLRRGFDVQRRVFLNPRLGTRGLIAAALTTSEAEFADFDRAVLDNIVDRFRELVRLRLPSDEARRWNRALERETANLPRLNADQPGIGPPRDMLGITLDALAIANVAAGKNTSLPLAFGIFGDWGAGKSFFMRLIQQQIAGFVTPDAEDDDGFEHAIVQIQFNAWHYAETNLWASLVGHIFEELDRWMTRDQPGTSTEMADKIINRLSTSRQLALEAVTELMQRRREHAKAGAKLTEAQGKLAAAEKTAAEAPGLVWRTVVDMARTQIAGDPEIQRELAGIQSTLKVPELLQSKAALTGALEQLDRSTTAARANLGALRSTLGSGRTIALAIGGLVGIPLLLIGVRGLVNGLAGEAVWSDIGSGVQALAGLLAAASVLVGDFTKRAKSLADKFAGLKANLDTEIARATQAERKAAQDAAADVAKSAAAVEQARTVVRATGEQVAAALKEYTEETGSLRLSRFVRARAGAEGYRKHLGLVSTIRKDFDQLEALMLDRTPKGAAEHLEEARLHYKARVDALVVEAKKDKTLEQDEIDRIEATAESLSEVGLPEAMAFRRIVLYIDDLDRCEPAKVVEVLQAVNMLLTFRLFVVMVAVDARWLSRSLEKQYPEFFGDDEGDAPASSGNGNEPRRATTADYLEKIFQIPYWVPAMDDTTSKALVGDLVAADRARAPQAGAGAGAGTGTVAPPLPPPNDDSKAPEDNQARTQEPPPESLSLTKDEIKSLTDLSPYLGGSPRRARRFVNVYRVAKASLRPGEVAKLEKGEHKALATQLAIATGAPNAFAAWVEISRTATDDTVEARISGIDANLEERRNITRALAVFREMAGKPGDALQQLARQSNRAGRFSFAMPGKTSMSLPASGAAPAPTSSGGFDLSVTNAMKARG